MDIKLIHLEVALLEKLDRSAFNYEIIKSHVQKDSYLYPLETHRFGDDYSTLSKTIYESLTKFPKLMEEISKISNEINIETEYIEHKAKQLSRIIGYDKSINICTAITGFECAASAYGNTIYFGLEWLVKPENIGIPSTDYRYVFMQKLSHQVSDFIRDSIPHEMVHIMSKKPSNEDFMFRIIEEGRACYVTHLLSPEWSLDKVLPMTSFDLEKATKNEIELMKFAYDALSNDANMAIKNLFSPIGQFMNINLSGYYLAYKLFEKYFSNIESRDEKISKIMQFTDGKKLFELLSSNHCIIHTEENN